MREILFKAKRADNKGWVEGLLTVMWGQYHIIKPSDENTAYPIDPETVCQYTGLTDNNDRKIFEGDICKFSVFDYNGHDTQYKGVVVYSGSRFMLWQSKKSEYYGTDGGFDIDWVISQDDEFEVVGNIFDNPKLLGN